MSVTDPIADMLTCIRNACKARHKKVDVPSSRMKIELAKLLLREKYVNNFKTIDDRKQGVLRIYLKYDSEKKSIISGLKRVSTPGCRIYVDRDSIPRVLGGMGTAILSTSKGILTDKEARAQGVGGEVVCHVW
ncbi:MAG: 30S ribosomal protein S8 [Candidatus Eiseniibacteriota bacterium]|nr:MAG: 30S ribosomal protein S8 [Candidatus Eisenbacteria bacterium]